MRRGWVVLAGWGALLVAIAAVQLTLEPEAIELALLGGSGAIVIAGGIAALVAERRGPRPRPVAHGDRELLRWTSASSVAVAVGICLLVLGWELGGWMIGIGAGVTALGIFGVVRETRTGRS
jgi:hypothetical protein